ncbi:MAG: PAS domain-containing sensor histidine kinase [Candidatus Dormibacteraeota bacterium]|nr:PAS domain-containing sensor histidine kinase [Candidatus Dormibacteraeota bacterium]
MAGSTSPFIELFRNFVTSDEGLLFLMKTLEDLPMAVILYDVAGARPEVVYLNRVARPVGIEIPGQVGGRPASEVFPRSGVDQDRWVREAATRGEPLHVSEYETGDRRIWEADVYPISRAGAALSFVLVMAIEVTESVHARRRSEAEREDQAAMLRNTAARMAALEKVKSDFLNLASHELRGPLSVLRGYLAMLTDGTLGDLPPRVRGVLPALNAKANQMAMLITQMLEAARLEDSQLQLKLEPVDLRRLVRQAVDTMGSLTASGQSLLLGDPGGEILLVADAGRVETIIVNLIDNALKYSPGGGVVEVTVAIDGDLGTLRVRDHGIGIAAEDLPRLFTRFGRLVTGANSHIPGTGLGLYLSREIARMHGGDITVRSTLEEGSEFTLSLPLKGPAE